MGAASTSARPAAGRSATRHAPDNVLMLLFLAAQFLSSGLLFIPGAQRYRFAIRAIPYVASLLMLLYYAAKPRLARRPPSLPFIGAALLLLLINLPRTDSQLVAGFMQIVFQVSIAAPLFWAGKMVRRAEDLYRLLRWFFLLNAVGTILGALQSVDPDRYNPPDFSTHASKEYVESLKFRRADGKIGYRVPGLSDMPGGGCVAGSLTLFSGILLMSDPRLGWLMRAFCFAMAALGAFNIYMTHVRILLLVAIGAVIVAGILMAFQGSIAQAARVFVAVSFITVGAFFYAVQVGGKSTYDRFIVLVEEGPEDSFSKNRGGFLSYTFNVLLDKYPLGAGLGRWGMMYSYYRDLSYKDTASGLHAEIQLTGWLYDGGIPMWILYGGGVLVATFESLRLAAPRKGSALPALATYVFGFCVMIIANTFGSPPFNTQLGIQFWLLVGALHGAYLGETGPIHAQVQRARQRAQQAVEISV